MRGPYSTFSCTVSQGKRASVLWKMTPRLTLGPRTGWPPTDTVPDVAGRKPATRLSSVDFPQPLGPSRHTNSPAATSRLIFETIRFSPKATLTRSRRISAPVHGVGALPTAEEAVIRGSDQLGL